MKKTCMYVVLALLSTGIFYEMYANLNGASSTTGAPGETTCSQSNCHGSGNGEGSSGGLADNSGGGFVQVSGISGTYTPGQTYTITVHVAQLGATRFGFNCEALDASNGNVGSYTITQTGTWLRTGINGTRTGVSQGHSGASGPTAGLGNDFFDFTFNWTAPASSVGPVTFYATGVAVNNSGLNDSGDQVYNSSMTVNPTVAPTAQILLSRTSFTFPSFYALANTVGNSQVFWTAGQGLSGNLTVALSGSPQFLISTSQGGPWVNSISLTATGGAVSGTAIYVQYTGPASGTQTGTVTVSGGSAASKTIPLSGVVRTGGTAPTITTPTPTVLNFGTVSVGSGTTTAQTFTYSFSNPVAGLTITAPNGYEISGLPTRDYVTQMNTILVGVGFTSSLYVRMKNPQVPGAYNGAITIAMPGATTQSVSVTGTATVPAKVVLASTNYMSLFTSNPGTPSATQILNVNGGGLTANLDVATNAPFEVSLSASSGFSSSVTIAPSGGSVPLTAVYVRYNSAVAALDYGNVYVNSTGAISQTIDVNGACFGTPTPIITETGSLTSFTTNVGTPSPTQTFTVSALNLTTNLNVNAPTDFEVSLSSGSGFGNLVSITPVSGTVPSTIIYARYNPATTGVTSSTLTITSTGAVTQTVAIDGSASGTTGINTVKRETVLMYPNPSYGNIFVELPDNVSQASISMVDMNGKQVHYAQLNSAWQQIDMSKIASGTYFVTVLDANKKVLSSQKFYLGK